MLVEQPEEFRLTDDHMARIVVVLQTVWPLEAQFAQLGAIMESVLMDWPKPVVVRFLNGLANRVIPIQVNRQRVH